MKKRMESLVIVTTILCSLVPNLFVLRAATSPHYNNIDQLLQCLKSRFHNSTLQSQVIYTPQNPDYSSIFEFYERNQRPRSSTSRHRPRVIVTPTHESEIQAAIYCSKKHGIQIRVRGGGHDYEGLSSTSNIPFLLVDMRNLRSISIDTKDNTSWVQSGATLGELYYNIAKKNKTLAFPAGNCPTVGVGGHFTGGGYSMMSRKHGLAIDNIVDAKVIDVKGRVLDRKSMGEALFWAIRGGGGTSFGIILAFKLKLAIVPEIVTVFNVTRTLEQKATNLVHKWQYICDKIDENLSIRVFIKSVRSSKDGNRRIQASFTSLFLGRENDLLILMQEKFPELGLVRQDCIETSWIQSILFFPGLSKEPLNVLLQRTHYRNKYFKGKSDYVTEPVPYHGLIELWKFLNEKAGENAQIQLSPYGGKLSTFLDSETPFPHRSGNIYMIHYLALWYTRESTEMHVNWTRKIYDYMTPFVSTSPRAAYFNYKDLDIGNNNEANTTSYEQASIWGAKYFKNNFDRLVRVKTMVDPNNFFSNEQSVPPLLTYASGAIHLNVEDSLLKEHVWSL